MRRAYHLLVAGALLGGCRDGVPLFAPDELPRDSSATYQLTFSLGHDRDPRWSASGDTVLYHTDLFGTLPSARGVLLEIPRERGTAQPVLANTQLGGIRLLATPAYSPDGTRIAYMDLVRVSPVMACEYAEPPAGFDRCVVPDPLLDSAALRVRRVDETRPFALDPAVAVKFEGVDVKLRLGEPGPYLERVLPFQFVHREELAMVFRPSWAPDGQRIVFSDGLRLRLWRVGETTAPPIPNSEDGVSPAWSPDGNWIAFTLLERGDSSINNCLCLDREQHRRMSYQIRARRLVLIRSDGTGRTVLGDGEEPAWSPNSQQIYARRSNEIVRLPILGGAATPVPNTTWGHMPAVSPNGRWLAFARRKLTATQDYDIWVVALGS